MTQIPPVLGSKGAVSSQGSTETTTAMPSGAREMSVPLNFDSGPRGQPPGTQDSPNNDITVGKLVAWAGRGAASIAFEAGVSAVGSGMKFFRS